MRITRRLSHGFGMLVVPVVCCAITAYFGYSGIFGERGLLSWQDTSAKLAIKKQELTQLRAESAALEHRISLLDGKTIDPDLLDEVSRGVLFQGHPGEVAVPRDKPVPPSR